MEEIRGGIKALLTCEWNVPFEGQDRKVTVSIFLVIFRVLDHVHDINLNVLRLSVGLCIMLSESHQSQIRSNAMGSSEDVSFGNDGSSAFVAHLSGSVPGKFKDFIFK